MQRAIQRELHLPALPEPPDVADALAVFAGFWLAVGHCLSALLCFITIIGIPFGLQHLKLAGIALAPIGKTIVSSEVAAAARKANGEASVYSARSS